VGAVMKTIGSALRLIMTLMVMAFRAVVGKFA
jgi:hypothetical protein